MAGKKSPSLAAFKAQLQAKFIAPREVEKARKIRDDHKWVVQDQEEVLQDYEDQMVKWTWFLYGWTAALEAVAKGKVKLASRKK